MNKKTIGLCLSGGGHRATAFSLGALLYLADVGEHQQISAISSVSGGSLTSGFLATCEKPLCKQTPREVEEVVKTLAHMLTGRPQLFWPAIGVVGAVLLSWFLHLTAQISFGFSFWETQLAFVVTLWIVALLAGELCGGTFWGWWGSWMYLGLMLAALVIGVAIWWSTAHWLLRFIVSFLAFSTPLLRCRVAEMAFAATIFKGKRRQFKLAKLHETDQAPQYVFCATEMHTGQHAWFTREFMYIPLVGLAKSKDLTVKSAVQMSANFPVAFPYRLIWPFKYQFHLGAVTKYDWPLFLIFSDGGVYDNMATSWFKEGPQCAVRLRERLSINQELGMVQPEEELNKWINIMEGATPDALIVVNSSEPYEWKHAAQAILPLWGEGRMLVSVNNSMYNHLGDLRKRGLRRQFFLKPKTGALVSIGEPPLYLMASLASQFLCNRLLEDHELIDADVGTIRAKALSTWLSCKDRIDKAAEPLSRIESKAIATTLRPLSKTTTATLLAHGYLSAMTNCHLLLDFPMLDEVPSFEDFERLAEGLPRQEDHQT